MEHPRIISFFLRFGLASVFLYAAIAALIHPANWVAFFPTFLMKSVSEAVLFQVLTIFSVVQLLLALWLLIGWKIFYAAILAGLMILGIIMGTLDAFDTTFRDIAILCMAIALAVLEHRGTKKKK